MDTQGGSSVGPGTKPHLNDSKLFLQYLAVLSSEVSGGEFSEGLDQSRDMKGIFSHNRVGGRRMSHSTRQRRTALPILRPNRGTPECRTSFVGVSYDLPTRSARAWVPKATGEVRALALPPKSANIDEHTRQTYKSHGLRQGLTPPHSRSVSMYFFIQPYQHRQPLSFALICISCQVSHLSILLTIRSFENKNGILLLFSSFLCPPLMPCIYGCYGLFLTDL